MRRQRRRPNWPRLRDLRVGDIIVSGYFDNDYHLLAKVDSCKKRHDYLDKTVYWRVRHFMSLVTGDFKRLKLTNTMAFGRKFP